MTKRHIARVCMIAGLATAGGLLMRDVIVDGIYNCHPDPYFPSYDVCSWLDIAGPVVVIGPWLVATFVLARREALVPFACWFMGLMWFLGAVAGSILLEFILPYLQEVEAPPWANTWPRHADEWVSFFGFVLLGAMFAMTVIGLLTAGVGTAMQAIIRARRRRRLPEAA